MDKLKEFIDSRVKAVKEAPERRGQFLVDSFKDHCMGAVYFAKDAGIIDTIDERRMMNYVSAQFDILEQEFEA